MSGVGGRDQIRPHDTKQASEHTHTNFDPWILAISRACLDANAGGMIPRIERHREALGASAKVNAPAISSMRRANSAGGRSKAFTSPAFFEATESLDAAARGAREMQGESRFLGKPDRA